MTDHPITPPPELVREWASESLATQNLCDRAAQWGADQELEACCKWVGSMFHGHKTWADELRNDRRSKPPTLNSIALQMLGTIERDAHYLPEITDTIRRALEALPE
jgi:hypothetical protein